MAQMTPEIIRQCCVENNGYRNPVLNEQLYLHFKGFWKVENLEPYTALKSVFLEGNALDTLEGLGHLKELKCLMAQQNGLSDLEGVEGLDALKLLNVSNNALTSLDGAEGLPSLETLQAAHNQLASVSCMEPLVGLPSLHTLDLSHNKMECGDGEELLTMLQSLKALKVLYLQGNPCVSTVRHYRKTCICRLPSLTYLDDRPVFATERRCAEAWGRGGLDAEREERAKIKEEEAAATKANHEYLTEMREKAKAARLKREAAGEEAGFFPGQDPGDFEEWEEVPEPPELVRAREQLARYDAREGEEEPPELTEARRKMAQQGLTTDEPTSWAPLVPGGGPEGEKMGAVRPPDEEEAVVAVDDGEDDLEEAPDLEEID
mmetsp:Transcript_6087/g.21344  ORF Transcript_6087/g.21344 Transcript_6087/m.21344 type:complete len:376 (-) Transcript_6087:1763-2890(-)